MRETHFRSAVSCYQATELVTGAVSLGFRLRLVVVSVSCSCPFCHIPFTAGYGRDHLHLWSEGTTEATLQMGNMFPAGDTAGYVERGPDRSSLVLLALIAALGTAPLSMHAWSCPPGSNPRPPPPAPSETTAGYLLTHCLPSLVSPCFPFASSKAVTLGITAVPRLQVPRSPVPLSGGLCPLCHGWNSPKLSILSTTPVG